jgi:hypothetical protein
VVVIASCHTLSCPRFLGVTHKELGTIPSGWYTARTTSLKSTMSSTPSASNAIVHFSKCVACSQPGTLCAVADAFCSCASAASADGGSSGTATAADMRNRRRCGRRNFRGNFSAAYIRSNSHPSLTAFERVFRAWKNVW